MGRGRRFFLISSVSLFIICVVAYFLIRYGRGQGEGNFVTINNHKIKVEIADNQASWYNGLSNRDKICDDCGMLFVFPDKKEHTFVMRNMRFGLDMIFIDGDKVVKVYENLKPEGPSPVAMYQGGQPVDKVLEVNAGTAGRFDIKMDNTVE